MQKTNNFSHAYIISGEDELTLAAAHTLAAAMLCETGGAKPCGACRHCEKSQRGIHPDISVTAHQTDSRGQEKREIYIDQIRAIVSDAHIMPNEADKKVYIIQNADTMNIAAQNALLKCLEEPPRHTALILTAKNAQALLETVRSRCVSISCAAHEEDPDAAANALAQKFIETAASGDELKIWQFCTSLEGETSGTVSSFARAVRLRLSDVLCLRAKAPGLSRAQTLSLLFLMGTVLQYARSNVGVKHIFGAIAVKTIDLKRGKIH